MQFSSPPASPASAISPVGHVGPVGGGSNALNALRTGGGLGSALSNGGSYAGGFTPIPYSDGFGSPREDRFAPRPSESALLGPISSRSMVALTGDTRQRDEGKPAKTRSAADAEIVEEVCDYPDVGFGTFEEDPWLLRGPGLTAKRWGFPGCLALLALLLQNVCLYEATQRYVTAMDALDAAADDAAETLEALTVAANPDGGRVAHGGEAGPSGNADIVVASRRRLGEPVFSCQPGPEPTNWTSTWPAARRAYCCEEWLRDGDIQVGSRVYCCLHFGQGCPTTTTVARIGPFAPAAPAPTPPSPSPMRGVDPDEPVPRAPLVPAGVAGGSGADVEGQPSTDAVSDDECRTRLRTNTWEPVVLAQCCKTWHNVGELAILTLARPQIARTCCGVLGDSCPAIVKSYLASTTIASTVAPAIPPAPSPTPAAAASPAPLPSPAPAVPGTQAAPAPWLKVDGAPAPAPAPQMPREWYYSRRSGAPPPLRAEPRGRFATFALSAFALTVPAAFGVFAVQADDLRTWTKACVCFALVTALEGALAWLAHSPGSGGWQGCQEKLGAEGLSYFRPAEDGSVGHFFAIAFELIRLEFMTVLFTGARSGHIRFCSDVPFSGRSCFVAVAVLGGYELLWRRTERLVAHQRQTYRMFAALAASGLVLLNSSLLVLPEPHYAPHAYLALALSALLFSSPALAIASERWAAACARADARQRGADGATLADDGDVVSDGTLLLPPCCLPFCCFHGQYIVGRREAFDRQLCDLRLRLLERSEAAARHEATGREALSHLESVRTELAQFTSMWVEERRKRTEVEEGWEAHRQQAAEALQAHLRSLDQERAARQQAEARQGEAARQLANMSEVPEQPRWTKPVPKPPGGAMSPKSDAAGREMWV